MKRFFDKLLKIFGYLAATVIVLLAIPFSLVGGVGPVPAGGAGGSPPGGSAGGPCGLRRRPHSDPWSGFSPAAVRS